MQTLNLETFKTKVFDFEKNQEWAFIGSKPAIIDFYADWCGPCRALSPILEDIAKDYEGKIDVYKVNTDLNPELAALFGVRGLPSLLFIPSIGEPAMSTGLVPREKLDKAIQEILKVQSK